MTWVFCQVGSLSVVEGTYLGRTLLPWETGSPSSWSGQYGSQISHVLRPSSRASARPNHAVSKGHICSSACAAVHPPRSNPPRRSSSGPPGPWYTPSKVSIIDAVSFMSSLLAAHSEDQTACPPETHRWDSLDDERTGPNPTESPQTSGGPGLRLARCTGPSDACPSSDASRHAPSGRRIANRP